VGFEVEGPPFDAYLGFLFPQPADGVPRFRFGEAVLSFQIRSSAPGAQVRSLRVSRGDGATEVLDMAGCIREDVPSTELAREGMASSFECSVPVPWVFPGPQTLLATVALDPSAPFDESSNLVHAEGGDDASGMPVLEAMSILDAAPSQAGEAEAAGASRAWVGTLHDGLVLVEMPRGAEGEAARAVVHYPGISLDAPYDAAFAGPQANYVTTLAREPDSPSGRALWVGTWATGIALFDPGPDLARHDDDTWTALLPPQLYPPYDPKAETPEGEKPDRRWVAQDMMETPTALRPDPTGDGLWVGTLNGLFFVEHGGVFTPDALRSSPWTRVADGAVLSLTASDDGTLWVGLSTEVVADALPTEWPPAQAPLLRVTRAPAEQVAAGEPFGVEPLWPQAGGQPAPEAGAVLALALEGRMEDGGALWVGTTAGLYRVTAGADGALAWGDATEALGLEPSAGPRLAVTALLVDDAGGLYVGAAARCTPDVGALVWRPAGGAPVSLDTELPDSDVVALARVGGDVLASTSELSMRGLALLGGDEDDCGGDVGAPQHAELVRLSPGASSESVDAELL